MSQTAKLLWQRRAAIAATPNAFVDVKKELVGG